MNGIVKFCTSFFLLLLIASSSVAQNVSPMEERYASRFLVQFPAAKSEMDPSYGDNYYAIEELKRFFNTIDISKVDSITIVGSSSPEGQESRNSSLALRRAESLKNLITNNYSTGDAVLNVYAKGDTWPEMLSLIDRDENFPNKSHTLIVLKNDVSYKNRLASLRFMEYKEAYAYLKDNIFPALRNAMAIVIAYKSEKPFVVYDSRSNFAKRPDFIASPDAVPSLPAVPESKAAPARVSDSTFSPGYAYTLSPLFAIKTNLLYDAASLLNLEIEVPIGKRWSILGEVIFPWWLWSREQICVQIFSAHLEGRYWFGDRDKRAQMTGWFAGFYVGGGYYDMEYRTKGYQGESVLSAGFTGGYAHTINKSGTLRMEYSLGVGYMYTHYREYEPTASADGSWSLDFMRHGARSWIGPTKAKISLVWMLDGRKKVKERSFSQFNPNEQ